MKYYKSILTFVFILMYSTVLTQENYQIFRDKPGNAKEILFYDSLQQAITAKVNLNDLNPFNGYNFRYIDNESGYDYYDLQNEDRRKVVDCFFPDNKIKDEQLERFNSTKANIRQSVIEKEMILIVVFALEILDQEDLQIGNRKEILIFDRHGELLAKIPENSDGFLNPTVTEDGKYLGYSYGSTIVDLPDITVPHGLKIYDIKKNQLVLDLKEVFFNRPVSFGRYIRISEPSVDSRTFYIIDPNTSTIYRRTFSISEVNEIQKFDKEGVSIGDKNGYHYKLLFKHDFEIMNY